MPPQRCSISAPATSNRRCLQSLNHPKGHPLTREGWQHGTAGIAEGLWGHKGRSCRDSSILRDPALM